jgi:hypothetical protein
MKRASIYNKLPRLLPFGRSKQLLYINMQWFQSELIFKVHRLLYHSTLGLKVIKKKKFWRYPAAIEAA